MRAKQLGLLVVIIAALLPLTPILVKGDVPSFRDHRDFFVPMRAFTSDALRAGSVPLWNPFNASGEPWLANPQTGVYYPPAWLMVLLPFQVGYVAYLMFHLGVLGAGFRRLFRLWASDSAATLVAAALVVSGPTLSLLDISNNLATFAWTPWLLALALDSEHRPGVIDSVLLALCFLGGEPLVAFVTWLAWTGIVLARFGRRGVLAIGWRLLTGVALCGAQLLPFLALLSGSDRVAGLDPSVAFRNSMSLLDWLALIVSPAGVQPGIGSSQTFLPSMYVSPIIVLLGIAAFSAKGPARVRRGWLIVFLVAMILASGSQFPMVGWILEALHLTVSRYPVKLALFGFPALGVLCAVGFDQLRTLSRTARVASAAVALALTVVALIVHRSPYVEVAVTGMIVAFLWLAGFLAILWLTPRFSNDGRMLLAVILLPVVVFESVAASRFLLTSTGWPFAAPYAATLDESYRVMRLEQLDARRQGASHVADRTAWMGGYLNLLSRQFDASTPAPVVDVEYQELHDVALSEPRMDLLDFLSVRYLMTERDLSAFGYRPIAEHRGVTLFERDGARPALDASFSPIDAGNGEASLERLLRREAELPVGVVIAEGMENEYPLSAQPDSSMSAESLAYEFDAVTAVVDLTHAALVSLNQKADEDWDVRVDGSAARTIRVNALFRGVEVEPGRHTIEWKYRPRSVRAGLILSIAALLVLAFEWRRLRPLQKKLSRSFHSSHA